MADPERLLEDFKRALASRHRATVNAAAFALNDANYPIGQQWRSVAMVLAHNKEWTGAIHAARRLVEAFPTAPQARHEYGLLLLRAGRTVEARQAIATLPMTGPFAAVRAHLIGSFDTLLGDPASSRAELIKAVTANPLHGGAWLALAMVGNLAADAEAADMILAAGSNRSAMQLPDSYLYALGKVHADRGEHFPAFEAFSQGAAIIKPQHPYDRRADEGFVQSAIAGSGADTLARAAETVEVRSAGPIFVTGMPRSGTTLVEQILTSHSLVSDGGEINCIQVIADEIETLRADELLASGRRSELADLYLHLLDERFPRAGRIVDKTLLAGRTLGLITTLFPDAPIIWMRRDPIDCAWSCFRTHFAEGAAWSNDLADIAWVMRLEDRLLAHWQPILGDRLLVLPYEDLVTAPEDKIPAILSHCGLAMEAAVLKPHETKRAVTTSSVTQVRQPINRDGIGAAAPYREWLEPFVSAYGD
ncbi:tetratricopeptide (TPR) repeat protein [Sphingomonas vulcanisoli]|uniref:Tetratricopeptide (TPR) repeat protein n=1 Tax=Sphingomonas vulcanisoli TaxID=1658060 RepID=A0ABX0TM21_9SPHN|nr:sulfotransferase [Sphingomonas vulcanisoli]NIJ06562.1 tetratricopeptide (TPR) repeat protein [Sphingomonas vulcanisoli]